MLTFTCLGKPTLGLDFQWIDSSGIPSWRKEELSGSGLIIMIKLHHDDVGEEHRIMGFISSFRLAVLALQDNFNKQILFNR